jgi:CubicO group peptidase (beta-lactamase class C family)
MSEAMESQPLRSIMVRVTRDGATVYESAVGESMTGVPATPAMRFRNGAVAFTYMSFVLARLVDEGTISLDDRLAKWYPDLPHADEISLKMLANMSSGYADYVYQPEISEGFNKDPFRAWRPEELIQIGTSKPMLFEPGTNWGYCHTNYVILGRVIERITGQRLDAVLKHYVFDPMGLRSTFSLANATIPEPALHVFSSERRGALGIPAATPFTEESTYWDPSWTTAEGALMVTDMADVTRSYEIIGSGEMLSPEMHQAMVGHNLTGFGQKAEGCPPCATLTEAKDYGLGVVLLGPWISQIKNFAGNGGTMGYLPSQRVAIYVGTSLKPEAFDAEGNYANPSVALFYDLTAAVAPGEPAPK